MGDIRYRLQGATAWTTILDVALPYEIAGYVEGDAVEVQTRTWSPPRTVSVAAQAPAAPVAAGGLADAVLTAGAAGVIQTAQDFTGAGLSFSLPSAPAWMSIDSGAGAISYAAPASPATGLQVVVRATDGGGAWAESGFSTEVIDVPSAIVVDGASLRLPSSNATIISTDNRATAGAHIAVPNFAPGGNAFFGANAQDMSIALLCEFPWEKLVGRNVSTTSGGAWFHLMGAAYGAVGQSQCFAVTYIPPDDPSAGANAGKLRLTFSPKGGSTTTRYIDLSAVDHEDYRRCMVVISRRGGTDAAANMSFEVIPCGSGAATLATTWTQNCATTAQMRSPILLGGDGNFYYTTAAAMLPETQSAKGVCWPGSLGWFGVYRGAASQADWEAVALGVAPATQLAAGTWAYRLDLSTVPAAGALTPDADSGGYGDAFVRHGAGGGMSMGSDLRPARDGATWFAAALPADGYVWGRAPGAATGSIVLSGAASGLDGQTVQARAFNMDGQLTADWSTVGTVAGGAWSGAFSALPNAGWGHVDVRCNGLVQRIRSRCGVGLKIAMVGQSQMEICAKTRRSVATYEAYGPISSARRWSVTSPTMDVVEGDFWQVADSAAAMSADLAALDAAHEPVCLVWEAQDGTSISELVSDASAGRTWTSLDALFAITGYDCTAWVQNWGTSMMTTGDLAGQFLDPLRIGAAPSAPYPVDHHLGDGTFPATMAFAISGLTRHTAAGDPDDHAETGLTEYVAQRQAFCEREEAYCAAKGLVYGPPVDDYAIGDQLADAFGPHPIETVPEGNPRLGIRLLTTARRAAQADATTDPTISGATISGGALTVAVTLPNGGTLQTAWTAQGGTNPNGGGVNAGDANGVQGFEVSEDGGATWTRASFTAAVSGAGVVLTRTSGAWATGTRARYLRSGPISYGDAARDRTLLGGLIYESGANEGGLGLPVRRWSGVAA